MQETYEFKNGLHESYENYDATKLVVNKLQELGERLYSEDNLESSLTVDVEEYIKNFENRCYVGEYLGQKFGLEPDENGEYDAETIMNLIKKKNKENGSLLSDGEKKNIRKWIFDKGIPEDREGIYKFCFAMGFNVEETGEFFFKGALARPYMMKNIKEAVFYFCLRNGKDFKYGVNLADKLMEECALPNNDPEENTMEIRQAIESFVNEEELVKYILSNKEGFTKPNNVAIEKIKKLMEMSLENAEKDRCAQFYCQRKRN